MNGNPIGIWEGIKGVDTISFNADGVVLFTRILMISFSWKDDKSSSKYPFDDDDDDEEEGDGSEFLSTYISTVPYKIDVLIDSRGVDDNDDNDDDDESIWSSTWYSNTAYIESLIVVSK